MGLPRSTYYDVPKVAVDEAEIVTRIKAIREEFETYGYRRVGAALRHQGIQLAIDSIDISDELTHITAPTLVLHVREDARAAFGEGRRMAAAIPGARFVPLEGRNHALLPGEPALLRFLDEIQGFLRS